MSNFASAFKSEIARVARKEAKGDAANLKAASARYRTDIAELKRRLVTLERQIKLLSKAAPRVAHTTPNDDSESSTLRWRPAGFKKLRAKLGLSANEMGKLLGCSGQSVYKWEDGKPRPRSAQLKSIAAVRTLGKRAALERLSTLPEA